MAIQLADAIRAGHTCTTGSTGSTGSTLVGNTYAVHNIGSRTGATSRRGCLVDRCRTHTVRLRAQRRKSFEQAG